MKNQLRITGEITTSIELRKSLEGCAKFTISSFQKPYDTLSQHSWDVIKDELQHMITKGLPNTSDYHINSWISAMNELKYKVFFTHEVIDKSKVIHFIGSECFTPTLQLNT